MIHQILKFLLKNSFDLELFYGGYKKGDMLKFDNKAHPFVVVYKMKEGISYTYLIKPVYKYVPDNTIVYKYGTWK